MNDDDPFIPVTQAAKLFNVTDKTMYAWLRDGRLKGIVRTRILPNGSRRLSENDIHTYLEENTK